MKLTKAAIAIMVKEARLGLADFLGETAENQLKASATYAEAAKAHKAMAEAHLALKTHHTQVAEKVAKGESTGDLVKAYDTAALTYHSAAETFHSSMDKYYATMADLAKNTGEYCAKEVEDYSPDEDEDEDEEYWEDEDEDEEGEGKDEKDMEKEDPPKKEKEMTEEEKAAAKKKLEENAEKADKPKSGKVAKAASGANAKLDQVIAGISALTKAVETAILPRVEAKEAAGTGTEGAEGAEKKVETVETVEKVDKPAAREPVGLAKADSAVVVTDNVKAVPRFLEEPDTFGKADIGDADGL